MTALITFVVDLLRMASALRRNPAFRRVSVVHANTSRAAIYGALATFGRKQALVVHLRDMVSRDSLGAPGFLAMRGLALRRAQLVIANSESTLATARPYLRNGTAAEVIPSPMGLDARPLYRDPAPVVSSVGMVARLTPWKGQELLIRAFASAFPSSKVVLRLAGGTWFGEESYEFRLRDLVASFGLEHRVEFLGHVSDVAAFIRDVDVCVQASMRPEPLGQNVLQYLAAGKPVVAVGAGGPAEWITDESNGLLYPMGSQDGLVRQMRRVVENADLRRTLARGARDTSSLLTDHESAMLHWRSLRALDGRVASSTGVSPHGLETVQR